MLYELRTTRVRPGGESEFERRLEAALPGRQRFSPLAGCWRTEIGPLLQYVELWPFRDLEHQRAVVEAAARSGDWPPHADVVLTTESTLLTPAPFCRLLDGSPQRVGPLFELRTYQVRPGRVQRIVDLWAPLLAGREALSPLLGAWSDGAERWFHLWPYPSLDARMNVRAEAQRRGIWPPPTAEHLQTLESKIMLPLECSPLQ